MIKGIIFDWGGVLIQNPTPLIDKYCSKYLGVSKNMFSKVFEKYNSDFQKGLLPENKLWEKVCAELGVKKPIVPSLWYDAFKYAYKPRNDMFSLASILHEAGYKTGYLSNTEIPAMEFFHEQSYDMFDALVFSCAEGTRKPEPRIYKIALKRLGLRPEDTVFIDDKKENVEGAERIGMVGILFETLQHLNKRLFELLGIRA